MFEFMITLWKIYITRCRFLEIFEQAAWNVFFVTHKEKFFCFEFSEVFHDPLSEYQVNGILRK